jgi:ABC-2 type transport system permease protein
VLRNPARFQDNEIFRQLSEGIRSHLDRQRMDIREFLTVRIVESAPMGQAGGEQGYMFPGVIAVGVMSSGLFLISSSFLYMKERFVLKRLAATPMRKLYFLAGLITTRMALSALSACLVLVVGGLVLGVRLPINWPLFALYLVAATLIMSGAGAVLALVAKSARSASEIAGLGMTIMMFVSGVYFPLEFLPPYFKAASLVLPATYVARGFRFVMGVEPMPGMRFIQETLLLCGLALAAIWIVAVKGSWEAE